MKPPSVNCRVAISSASRISMARMAMRVTRWGKLPTIAALSIILLGAEQIDDERSAVRLGRVKPKSSTEIASSPWGIQIGTLNERHIEIAGRLGVKWTRLNASWREVETERGKYSWKGTDKAFSSALKNGIVPFVCLAGSNRLYCGEAIVSTSQEREIYGTNPLPPTRDPEALAAWLRFVRATVERYKGQIRYWEVWNEPNHWAYWGAQPDGEEYGVLLRETAKVIKSVDPSAKIAGGALAGLDPEFTSRFLADGNAQLIDIVTFHNYAPLPEERIYKAIETWNVINSHNPQLELWQGECGFPSHSSTRDYRGTSPWGLMIQAKWLLRQAFTDIFFCRTTLSNYFKLVHSGGRGDTPKRSFMSSIDSVLGFPERGGARVKSVGVNEKCILENPDLTPKPAYFAYQNLCAVFDNRYKPVASDAVITVKDQGIFYGVGAEDDAFPSKPLVATFRSDQGNTFIAYWLPWHPQEAIRHATIDLRTSSLRFHDPVLIDLLSGEVLSVKLETGSSGEIVLKGIPLADYPFAVAERKEVEFGP